MKKILLIDDEIEVGKAMARVLRFYGYEVECANSALKALDSLERFHPDLFLIDSFMPVMSGLELSIKFRALPKHRSTPIVLLTILMSDELSKSENCVEVLLKPVPAEKLKKTVEAAFRNP